MTVIPYPSYSPDVALYHFFLFPILKVALQGRKSNDTAIFQTKSQDKLQTLYFTEYFERGVNSGLCV
jgi:hypothetical protein